MPVFNNALAGAAGSGGAADLEIKRSLRFNSGDSGYLSRDFSAGNRKTWTWSGWVKRSKLGAQQPLFNAGVTANQQISGISFFNNDKLEVWTGVQAVSTEAWCQTDAVFRDTSAWYHIVVAVDTTQTTPANRVKIYVNGSLQDIAAYASYNAYPSQDYLYAFNNTVAHQIGRDTVGTPAYGNGYLADVYFIDGQALAASDFGKTDSYNNWNPKAYNGTYPGNSFHLDFSDNSSKSALGDDSSGNNNDWTVNNLVASVSSPNYASSSNWTQTGNGLASGTDYKNAWDGNTTSTFLNFLTNTGGNNDVAYTFPGSGVSVSSYVRLYVGAHSNNERQWRVNSEAYQANNTTGYLQYNFSGTLTSIDGYNTWNGGNSIQLYAVEVDGTVLTYDPPESIDSLIDTPTNYQAASGNNGGNYATLNAAMSDSPGTLSNGNLELTGGSGAFHGFSTIGVSSGKWYAEVTGLTGGGASNYMAGIADLTQLNGSNVFDAFSRGYGYRNDAKKINTNTVGTYGATYSTSDVIGVAADLDNGTITFYLNGSSQGTAYTGIPSGVTYHFAHFCRTSSDKVAWNFGQRPFYISSVPSGFKSLCTQNLTDPTIADGLTAFDAVKYEGNGTTKTISGLAFRPDLIWIKERTDSGGVSHYFGDTVRGVNKALASNSTSAESTNDVYGYISTTTSDGFTVTAGSNDNFYTNGSPETYVAWAWDAGTTTDTNNTAGSITPTGVRANTSAGFSIVTADSLPTTNQTFGHGLNATPHFIIGKNRAQASQWDVYHKDIGIDKLFRLNTLAAASSASSGDSTYPTSPTSSVFGFRANGATNNYVWYCFAPVAGYSAFGKWTGGSDAFVYLGFRPKFLLIKANASGNDWLLFDSERSTFNSVDDWLTPNSGAAETQNNSVNYLDFLSNGFKIKGTSGYFGASVDMIYAAFAEHPFKTARAR